MTTARAIAPVATKPSVGFETWAAFGALALVWLQLISRLRLEWTVNPQYSYAWTVPLLAAFIVWRRRESAPLARPPSKSFAPAAAMILCATLLVPVRLIQEASPDWRLMSWTMALAVVVITFSVFYLNGGWPWVRHFAFPILFFLVAVPWPTQFEQAIIQGLMRAVTAINVEVLNEIGIPALQLGNVIEVGTGFVGIDEACTGVRSLQATFMVSLFLGELYGFSITRRVTLLLAGVGLAFACNLVRTFLLVWVSAEQGIEAIKKWHDPAGHTILAVCLAGLWAISLLMRGREAPPDGSATRRARTRFRLSPLLVTCLLVCSALAEAGTQLWYRAHEANAGRMEPWRVDWPTEAANWATVPIAPAAEELLRYSEGGGGSWTGEDGKQWGLYFFKWLPGRTAGLFVKNHRPDICLPASGVKQLGDVQYKLMQVNGVLLPIRSYRFESRGEPLHVYYCYWDGSKPDPGKLNDENWTASGRFEAVRNGKRDVGTQILEILVFGYDRSEDAEAAVRRELSHIVHRG